MPDCLSGKSAGNCQPVKVSVWSMGISSNNASLSSGRYFLLANHWSSRLPVAGHATNLRWLIFSWRFEVTEMLSDFIRPQIGIASWGRRLAWLDYMRSSAIIGWIQRPPAIVMVGQNLNFSKSQTPSRMLLNLFLLLSIIKLFMFQTS
jgi:hypothetical protein